jgi:uncharacterized membrane protein YccC
VHAAGAADVVDARAAEDLHERGGALRGHTSRWSTWLQLAIGLSIAIAIVGTVYHEVTGKPEDTLYIELGQLRSRAAELARVADDASAERLTGAYIEAQSQQLAKAVAKLRDELASAKASAPSPDAARAREMSDALLALAQALGQKGRAPDEAAALRDKARAIVDALIPIERSSRPS